MQKCFSVPPMLFSLLISFASTAISRETTFPLQISSNGRHFVDGQGYPFLYHADTGWQIFSQLTTEEAREYLLFRKNQGFNTIQTQIVMSPEQVDRYGRPPFGGDADFSRPDPAYHDHVARVLDIADSLGLLVTMSQPWLGCCEEGFGNRPDKPIRRNGPDKNRKYGEYLGRKFSRFNNLFWIIGGDNDPKGDLKEIVAFAEGLRAAAPKHQLLTYHASASHSSTDLFHYADWLGFSMVYTYWRDKPGEWVNPEQMPEVYEVCLREYNKSHVMPFILGEAQYEGFTGNDIGTPFQVRRQPYWIMLCGGAGHAYGSELWNFPANWREIMLYPGAGQLRHFIDFFSALPWWMLVPDQRHRVVVAGYGEYMKTDYVTTAVSEDSKLLVSYLSQRQTLVADLSKLHGGTKTARWFDPRNGQYRDVPNISPNALNQFTPPSNEDWVLLVKSK